MLISDETVHELWNLMVASGHHLHGLLVHPGASNNNMGKDPGKEARLWAQKLTFINYTMCWSLGFGAYFTVYISEGLVTIGTWVEPVGLIVEPEQRNIT